MKKLTSCKVSPRLAGSLLLAVASACAVRADYPSAVQALGPLDYWRLNETTNSPAYAIVTNHGSAGSSATGIIRLGAPQGVPGIVGSCVYINNDGATGSGGPSVEISNNPALNPEPPFSVEFWANPVNLGTDANGLCPLSSMSPFPTGISRSGYLFYINDVGTVTFNIGGENGYAGQPKGGTAPAGSWTHIVGEFDGTNISLYVNGSLVSTVLASPSKPFHPNTWVSTRIGATSLNGSSPPAFLSFFPEGNRGFDGYVDELAIYTNLLSAATISAHYSGGAPNPATYDSMILSANPVGYYNLDEPAYTPPPANYTYPMAADLGSLGDEATNVLGALAAQPGVPYVGFGANNLCVYYDGVSGATCLSNAFSTWPQPDITGQPITLMAWVKPGPASMMQTIIGQGMDVNANETYLRMGLTYDWEGPTDGAQNGGLPDVYYYEIGSGNSFNLGQAADAEFPVPSGDIGNWVFVVGTWDGANWNLYRNGTLVAQTADEVGPIYVAAPWAVGSRFDADQYIGFNFNGYIDEPAIFNVALTSDQVSNLYSLVQVPPVITVAPQAQTGPIYTGGSITYSIWADGTEPLYYQWLSNNIPIPGQTGTNISFSGLRANDSATYAVQVTNLYGSITVPVVLSVSPSLPPISIIPDGESRWNTLPYKFTASSVGNEPVDYHWFHGGTELGVNAAMITGPTTAGAVGDYTLIISNSFGIPSTSAPVSLTLLTPPNLYVSTIVGDGPIAYYRFDESNGPTAHDYAGGHDGIDFNVAFGQPGYSLIDPDTAYGFSGAIGCYVGDIDGTTNGINFSGSQPFSLEAWANGGSSEADQAAIIDKGHGNNGSNPDEQFCIDVSGGAYRFFVRDQIDNIYQAVANHGPDGSWHHIVGTSDGNNLSIYFDGVLEGTGAAPAGGVITSADGVDIGAEQSGVFPAVDWDYSGTIDEVAVYNTALSSAQVKAHYAAAYGSGLGPFFGTEPESVTNVVGLPIELGASAAGTQPLSYQWSKNGSPLSDGNEISGSQSGILTLNPVSFADEGTYSLHVANSVSSTDSVFVTVTVIPVPTTAPAISGLVMHLPLSNNLVDITGRGNNGTNFCDGKPAPNGSGPGATFIPDGPLGNQALHYDTITNALNGPVTNYVVIGNRPDLQFGTDVNFSVAFWIRLAAGFAGDDLPFFTDAKTSLGGIGWDFAPSFGKNGKGAPGYPGSWAYTLYDAAGNGVRVYGDLDIINDGAWHHLAYVFDRRPKHSGIVYLDGSPNKGFTQAGTGISAVGDLDTTNSAVIGQDPTGKYAEEGAADIADLGVWRRALLPLEVGQIFTAGATNNLSYLGVPLSFTYTNTSSNTLVLSWSEGTLQVSTNPAPYTITVTGPSTNLVTNIVDNYSDVSGFSPYIVYPTNGPEFFRVKF